MQKIIVRKGGPGSGNKGHKGRPGFIGGSGEGGGSTTEDNPAPPPPSTLSTRIASGELDIPKDIKKRKFQMNTSNLEAEAYAEKVWNAEVEEMKALGLSDEDIRTVDVGLYQLMTSTDRIEAKLSMAALMAHDGASESEVRAAVEAEYLSRLTEKGIAQVKYGQAIKAGLDPMSDEGLVMYQKAKMLFTSYTPEELRDPSHYMRKSILEDASRSSSYADGIDEVVKDAMNPNVQKGFNVIREASQQLYDRNIESPVLYRGIYDQLDERGRGSGKYYRETEDGYYPVKEIKKAIALEHPAGTSWVNQRPEDMVRKAESVEIDCDRLVAWTPSRQISRTFSAGGGHSGSNVKRKAMLAKTNVPSSKVAYYWPAIYHSLGNSIDTKEVWLWNPQATMNIHYTEFELIQDF